MRHRLLSLLIAAASLGATAPGGAAAPGVPVSPEGGAPRGALTSGGSFYVTYLPDPDPIPLNEMFEIRFEVTRADDRGQRVAGAVVTADAVMPLHKHGMNLQPRVESRGDGTATGRGFLLHMEGQWELRVGVAVAGQMERATFEILLEP